MAYNIPPNIAQAAISQIKGPENQKDLEKFGETFQAFLKTPQIYKHLGYEAKEAVTRLTRQLSTKFIERVEKGMATPHDIKLIELLMPHFEAANIDLDLVQKAIQEYQAKRQDTEHFELKASCSKLKGLDDHLEADPVGIGNELATDEGIYLGLVESLGNSAHVIHPAACSVLSPCDQNVWVAQEASIQYAKMVAGYSTEGESIHNGVAVAGELDKPVVMVLNTQSVKARSSTDTRATGGSHWVTVVVLPAYYQPPEGEPLNNPQPIMYFVDSYYSHTKMPTALQRCLTEETTYTITPSDQPGVQIEHNIPALVPGATCESLNPPQQLGGVDCGWWCLYNALSLVNTGRPDDIQKFTKRSRGPAKQLRQQFPNLAMVAEMPESQPDRVSREERNAIISQFKRTVIDEVAETLVELQAQAMKVIEDIQAGAMEVQCETTIKELVGDLAALIQGAEGLNGGLRELNELCFQAGMTRSYMDGSFQSLRTLFQEQSGMKGNIDQLDTIVTLVVSNIEQAARTLCEQGRQAESVIPQVSALPVVEEDHVVVLHPADELEDKELEKVLGELFEDPEFLKECLEGLKAAKCTQIMCMSSDGQVTEVKIDEATDMKVVMPFLKEAYILTINCYNRRTMPRLLAQYSEERQTQEKIIAATVLKHLQSKHQEVLEKSSSQEAILCFPECQAYTGPLLDTPKSMVCSFYDAAENQMPIVESTQVLETMGSDMFQDYLAARTAGQVPFQDMTIDGSRVGNRKYRATFMQVLNQRIWGANVKTFFRTWESKEFKDSNQLRIMQYWLAKYLNPMLNSSTLIHPKDRAYLIKLMSDLDVRNIQKAPLAKLLRFVLVATYRIVQGISQEKPKSDEGLYQFFVSLNPEMLNDPEVFSDDAILDLKTFSNFRKAWEALVIFFSEQKMPPESQKVILNQWLQHFCQPVMLQRARVYECAQEIQDLMGTLIELEDQRPAATVLTTIVQAVENPGSRAQRNCLETLANVCCTQLVNKTPAEEGLSNEFVTDIVSTSCRWLTENQLVVLVQELSRKGATRESVMRLILRQAQQQLETSLESAGIPRPLMNLICQNDIVSQCVVPTDQKVLQGLVLMVSEFQCVPVQDDSVVRVVDLCCHLYRKSKPTFQRGEKLELKKEERSKFVRMACDPTVLHKIPIRNQLKVLAEVITMQSITKEKLICIAQLLIQGFSETIDPSVGRKFQELSQLKELLKQIPYSQINPQDWATLITLIGPVISGETDDITEVHKAIQDILSHIIKERFSDLKELTGELPLITLRQLSKILQQVFHLQMELATFHQRLKDITGEEDVAVLVGPTSTRGQLPHPSSPASSRSSSPGSSATPFIQSISRDRDKIIRMKEKVSKWGSHRCKLVGEAIENLMAIEELASLEVGSLEMLELSQFDIASDLFTMEELVAAQCIELDPVVYSNYLEHLMKIKLLGKIIEKIIRSLPSAQSRDWDEILGPIREKLSIKSAEGILERLDALNRAIRVKQAQIEHYLNTIRTQLFQGLLDVLRTGKKLPSELSEKLRREFRVWLKTHIATSFNLTAGDLDSLAHNSETWNLLGVSTEIQIIDDKELNGNALKFYCEEHKSDAPYFTFHVNGVRYQVVELHGRGRRLFLAQAPGHPDILLSFPVKLAHKGTQYKEDLLRIIRGFMQSRPGVIDYYTYNGTKYKFEAGEFKSIT